MWERRGRFVKVSKDDERDRWIDPAAIVAIRAGVVLLLPLNTGKNDQLESVYMSRGASARADRFQMVVNVTDPKLDIAPGIRRLDVAKSRWSNQNKSIHVNISNGVQLVNVK